LNISKGKSGEGEYLLGKMIFKLPQKSRKEKTAYQFGRWVVVSNRKTKAEKDLKRFLGEKKFEKVEKEMKK
jgi:hypothetical protein